MLLRLFGAVFGTALTPFLDADRIQRAADYVIAHAGQILDPAAADQHYRVLLQVVSDARDVRVNLVAIGEPHPRDLAQCRVGLLGRSGLDLGAHAAFLRRAPQGRRTYLVAPLDSRLANMWVEGRHVISRACILPGGVPPPPGYTSLSKKPGPEHPSEPAP